MRIGIDTLAIQSPYSKGRGIGRYSRSLLYALLKLTHEHQVVLYTYEDLDTEELPTSGSISIRNVRRYPDEAEHTLEHAVGRIVRENTDDLDWYVLLSPFETWEFFGLPPKSLQRPKLAAVVYDLIPFLFQETYLYTEDVGRWFYRHLRRLKQYDQLLAISEATRQDTIDLLGLPGSRVTTIGTSTDFTTTEANDVQLALTTLDRFNIVSPYLFCLGSSDSRKNLDGLLKAFAIVAEDSLSDYQLVIGCAFKEEELQRYQQLAARLGVAARVVFTNAVTDQELDLLYRNCSLFVFPSHYEGFGLPILEAMQRRVPVIAGNNSAQPEVVGDAGLLIDVNEPSSIARAITQLLADPQSQARFVDAGSRQALGFQWDQVASKVLAALSDNPVSCIVNNKGRSTLRSRGALKERVALVSPFPPRRSGIAAYAEQIAEALRGDYLVDLIHDSNYRPDLANATSEYGAFKPKEFLRRIRQVPYRQVFYQFGNSSFHHYMFDLFQRVPGVVTLHDLAMAGFQTGFDLESQAFGSHLIQEADYNNPGDGAVLQELLQDWAPGTWELPELLVKQNRLFHRRFAEHASTLIVHSDEAAQLVLSRFPWVAPKLRVHRIGAVSHSLSAEQRIQARARFGIDNQTLLFGSVGILHSTKLNLESIRAFNGLANTLPHTQFIVAGRDLGNGEVAREVELLGLSDRVRLTGHLDEAGYRDILAAIDVGICLRRPPTNGESSAALLDLLRHGVPTIVCDIGSFQELPDDAVAKVTWVGDGAVDALRGVMKRIAVDQGYRRKLGENALGYVRSHHNLDDFIQGYKALCRSGSSARVQRLGPLWSRIRCA